MERIGSVNNTTNQQAGCSKKNQSPQVSGPAVNSIGAVTGDVTGGTAGGETGMATGSDLRGEPEGNWEVKKD